MSQARIISEGSISEPPEESYPFIIRNHISGEFLGETTEYDSAIAQARKLVAAKSDTPIIIYSPTYVIENVSSTTYKTKETPL